MKRKTSRKLFAACMALLLALPFSVLPNAAATPAAEVRTNYEFHCVAEAMPDAESAGAATTGRAALKPGERLAGGCGGDWHTSPKAVLVGQVAFLQTFYRFISRSRKQSMLSSSPRAAHSCRAPPVFSSQF